ncbi:hypothetical protein EK904_012054, partial [Melospiza melodia maxima]
MLYTEFINKGHSVDLALSALDKNRGGAMKFMIKVSSNRDLEGQQGEGCECFSSVRSWPQQAAKHSGQASEWDREETGREKAVEMKTGILSTLGNGYVIFMSSKRKKKLRPAEIMTVNLAVCDLGISGKPFSIISFFSHRWMFGWMGCRWYGWAGFFFGCGSLITMTAVSLDRYLKICHLSYVPFAGVGNYAPEPFGTSCTLDWWLAQASVAGQVFVLSILFFCLLFPTAVIVFSYVKIILKVKSSTKEVSHYDTRIQNSHILEMKLTKVAMLICAGFLLAWIPYAVVSVWSAFGRPDSVPIQFSVIPTLLAKSAAMYNPIIYQVIDCKFACCRPGGLKDKSSLKKSSTIPVLQRFIDVEADHGAVVAEVLLLYEGIGDARGLTGKKVDDVGSVIN